MIKSTGQNIYENFLVSSIPVFIQDSNIFTFNTFINFYDICVLSVLQVFSSSLVH